MALGVAAYPRPRTPAWVPSPGDTTIILAVTTGVLVAAFAGIVVSGLIAVSAAMGAGSAVANAFSGNILAWAGSLAGITAVFGLVGFFVGKASE
jgi:hypothetical protein